MSVVLRFAPSPTGVMHIGNARTALVNWLYAKAHQGKFYLRFDDTDQERSRPEYADQIARDLAWLGWTYDETFKQTDRLQRYSDVSQQLMNSGHLYPCYESPQELDIKRKRQLALGQPPIYDRAALKLTEADHQRFQDQGIQPHWRFKLNSDQVVWQDLAHGEISINVLNLSDPVLIRADQSPIYTLSSVIDDMDYGITHIIRGDDHITNTAVQLQIWAALGKDVSTLHFAHLPLITGAEGQGLSKRLGSLGIRDLRDQGIEPLAISNYLSKLGTGLENDIATSLEQLIAGFDIAQFAQNSPKFSTADLERINAKIIHTLPYSEVQSRLPALGLPEISQEFWHAISGNLNAWQDIKSIWASCFEAITPIIEQDNADYIALALQCLPEAPWGVDTWRLWTKDLKAKTGRQGPALYMPLRQALTACTHGPEMQKLLLFIGLEKAKLRLQGRLA